MKAIDKKQNKSGKWYALVELENGNGLVMVRKVNYSHGRNVEKWVFCNKHRQPNNEFQQMVKQGLPMSEARAMFDQKLKGRAK